MSESAATCESAGFGWLASPALVALLLEKRRHGRSYREIADGLNRAGVRPLGGGREWYPATVQKIVRRHER